MTKVYIYLRVSTKEQSSQSQLTAIKAYCQQCNIAEYEIYQDEGISGAKQSRPALDSMMAKLREQKTGTVIVYSFSRFARSTIHLLSALNEFKTLGISFVSITERLETNTPMGRACFGILASIAELERDLIRERVKAGMINAKLKGRKIGAPKKVVNHELLSNLVQQKLSYKEISKLLNISSATVCREVKLLQKAVA